EEEVDVHFEPLIKLEAVQVKTLEEDEDVRFKMRAKLFRFERGTGEVRLLQHKDTKKIRLLMRRDQTLKICANHYVTAEMNLTPNVGSDRSWVWNVTSDSSDDCAGPQTLAIRLANPDYALQFKVAFEDAQKLNADLKTKIGGDATADTKEETKTEEKKEAAKPEEERKEESA
ncbi:hypothetical protein BGZ65_008988, partial [Modicella reniformis]